MLSKILSSNKAIIVGAVLLGTLLSGAIQFVIGSIASLNELQMRDTDVLSNVRIIDSKFENGVRKIKLLGQKNRNDCGAPIKLSGYHGSPLIPLDVVELEKRFENPVNSSRPYIERPGIPGQDQDFGWWVIIPDPAGDFYLYVDYICGQSETTNPYLKKTILGPYNLDRYKKEEAISKSLKSNL